MASRTRKPIPSREESLRAIDEVMGGPSAIDVMMGRRGRPTRRPRKPRPLPGLSELLFRLATGWMGNLSGNAWKVVSYIAVRQVESHPGWAHGRIEMLYAAEIEISLKQLSDGMPEKNRARLDGGTGLAKSSLAAAINEAASLGILRRTRREGRDGRTLATSYGIDWEMAAGLSGVRTGPIR